MRIDESTFKERMELLDRFEFWGTKAPNVIITYPPNRNGIDFALLYASKLLNKSIDEVMRDHDCLELRFPWNGDKTDFARFFDSPNVIANMKFANHFTGVFCIDMSELEPHFAEDHKYIRLLEYVCYNSQMTYVFEVRKNSNGIAEELYKSLSGFIDVDLVDLKENDTESEFALFVVFSFLAGEKVCSRPAGRKVLLNCIDKIKSRYAYWDVDVLISHAMKLLRELRVAGYDSKNIDSLSVKKLSEICERIVPDVEIADVDKSTIGFKL